MPALDFFTVLYKIRFVFPYSGEINKETTFSRSSVHGESAGDREGRVGVYLLIAR